MASQSGKIRCLLNKLDSGLCSPCCTERHWAYLKIFLPDRLWSVLGNSWAICIGGFWWLFCFCVWFGFCLLVFFVVFFFKFFGGCGGVHLQVTTDVEVYKGRTIEVTVLTKPLLWANCLICNEGLMFLKLIPGSILEMDVLDSLIMYTCGTFSSGRWGIYIWTVFCH